MGEDLLIPQIHTKQMSSVQASFQSCVLSLLGCANAEIGGKNSAHKLWTEIFLLGDTYTGCLLVTLRSIHILPNSFIVIFMCFEWKGFSNVPLACPYSIILMHCRPLLDKTKKVGQEAYFEIVK